LEESLAVAPRLDFAAPRAESFQAGRANPPPDRVEGVHGRSRARPSPPRQANPAEVLNYVWGDTMKRTRYFVAACLLAFSVQAKADGWVTDDINDILGKVRTMFTTITGDVKDTAQDFKRQLTSLTNNGATVKETVDDAFAFLEHRRTPFLDFVNGGSVRCGQGSPCFEFRGELEDFVQDVADLRDRFPHIDRHGLGDGTLFIDIIDHLPPLALFSLYEILQRVPNWQDIPQNMADLYDEIGDPDVFSLELPGTSHAAAESVASVTLKAASAGGQGTFGAPVAKTDVFCSKGKQPKVDPVRMNRLKGFFSMLKSVLDGASEWMPDKKTIVAAGEGTDFKMPTQATLKTVAGIIEVVFGFVDAHRANLDLCKKIESDIAARTPLFEYRTAAGNKKAYWVVKGIIKAQGNFAPKAESLLDEAGNLHRNYRWVDAYNKICDAYAAIL
jgi:hypothetical protein